MAIIQLTDCSVSLAQCDQERPYCTPCLKSGTQCEGYERERVFVNYKDASTRYTKATISRVTQITPLASERGRQNAREDIILPDSLAMTAGEQVFVAHFLNIYSPGGQPMSPWAWIASRATDPAPRQALLALTLSTLGEEENDANMRAEGARLYGKALKEAAADLGSPTKGTSDATLVTISMMRLYEVNMYLRTVLPMER